MTDPIRKWKDEMKLLAVAATVATKAHEGQTDKQGQPYIHHPYAVANSLTLRDQGWIVKAAAFLHDVLEDTSWTEDDLRMIFPAEVVDIVVILTRPKGETYTDFIERVAKHRGAALVKVADLLHNLDPDRGDGSFVLPEGHRKRYLRALDRLMPVIAS